MTTPTARERAEKIVFNWRERNLIFGVQSEAKNELADDITADILAAEQAALEALREAYKSVFVPTGRKSTDATHQHISFLRAHADYLDTGEKHYPFVNSARAICEVNRSTADMLEAMGKVLASLTDKSKGEE